MSFFSNLLEGMKKPASTTPKEQWNGNVVDIPFAVFMDINKQIEPIMRENERAREMGRAAMQGLTIG